MTVILSQCKTHMRVNPDSSDWLRRSHVTQYRCDYYKLDGVPLRLLRRYTTATVTGATAHAEAAEYPQRYFDLAVTTPALLRYVRPSASWRNLDVYI